MTIKKLLIATCDECGRQLQSEKGIDGLVNLLEKEDWTTIHWAEAEVLRLRDDGLHSHYCRKCWESIRTKMPNIGSYCWTAPEAIKKIGRDE